MFMDYFGFPVTIFIIMIIKDLSFFLLCGIIFAPILYDMILKNGIHTYYP